MIYQGYTTRRRDERELEIHREDSLVSTPAPGGAFGSTRCFQDSAETGKNSEDSKMQQYLGWHISAEKDLKILFRYQ